LWLTWQGILPQVLKFTPEFERELDVFEQQDWQAVSFTREVDPVDPLVSTDRERVAGPWLWKYHLSSLIEDRSEPKDYFETSQYYIDEDKLEYEEGKWARRSFSATAYTVLKRRLLSLHHVGLDFRGGLEGLYEVYPEDRSSSWYYSLEPFPTASILVIDPQAAKKYFQIGVHLNQVSASLSNYPARDLLDQATKIYSMIKELVEGHSEQNMPTEAELDASISATTHENLVWEYKREKFRLATVKKYRDIMIQKAVEENVSLPLWCIRLS
jgi:hypothetical protein